MMKRKPVSLLPLAALLLFFTLALSACSPSSLNGLLPGSAKAAPQATPTDCGCSAEGPRAKTQEAALPEAAGTSAGPSLTDAAPTPEGQGSTGAQWQTFTAALPGSPAREVSFEYPAAYADGSFGFCAPRLSTGIEPAADAAAAPLLRVDLGSRTTLTVTAAPSGDLKAAAETLRAESARAADTFDEAQEATVAGVPALRLPYRMGGAGRFGEVALFEKDGLLYRLETGVPSACDIPAQNFRELDAYQRVLESIAVK